MTPSDSGPSSAQALRNRGLDAWQRRCGWPIASALVLALTWVAVQSQLLPALHRETARLEVQREHAKDAAERIQARDAPARPAPTPVFPGVEHRGQDVGNLLDLAQRRGLLVERADYRVDPVAGAQMTRLHAQLPVVGTYSDVRAFIADILDSLPNLALESVELERTNTRAARLHATLHLVLFYDGEAR